MKNYYIIPCRPNTKISSIKNWQNINEDQKYDQDSNNKAAVLTDKSLVIDIDIKNDSNAVNKAKEFCDDIGIEYELNVKTPSGGFHIYLEKDEDIKINKKYLDKYGKGVEFKSKGSYVLIPHSVIDGIYYTYLDKKDNFKKLDKDQNDKLRKLFEKTPYQEFKETSFKNNELTLEDIKRFLSNIDPDCDYDTWIKVMIALHNHFRGSYEGYAIWDEWSSYGSKYSENNIGEMENKYNKYRSDNTNNNITIATLIYLYNQNNGFGSKTLSSINHDVKKATWLDEWAYYPCGQGSYINIKTLEKHNTTSFNDMNKDLIEPIILKDGTKKRLKPTLYIEKNVDMKMNIIQGIEYNPTTNSRIFINKDGNKILNLFKKETIPKPAKIYTEEGEKAIQYLLDHFNLICDGDGSIILYYLAHLLQRVGVRMNWFILLGSKLQGVGKSFILSLVERMLGSSNCKMPRLADLLSPYNEWADAKLFLGIHEFYAQGSKKHEIMNELKSIITDEKISLRRLYSSPVSINLYCNGIFCTNFIESLPSTDDRRIYPIFLKFNSKEELDEMRGFDDFELTKRVSLILKNSDQIAKYLLELKIPSWFNENNRAPESELKKTLINIEQDSIIGLKEAEQLISDGGVYHNKDYIVMSKLWIKVEELLHNGDNTFQLSRYNKIILRNELGYYGSSIQVRINKVRERCYFKKTYKSSSEMCDIINKYKQEEDY